MSAGRDLFCVFMIFNLAFFMRRTKTTCKKNISCKRTKSNTYFLSNKSNTSNTIKVRDFIPDRERRRGTITPSVVSCVQIRRARGDFPLSDNKLNFSRAFIYAIIRPDLPSKIDFSIYPSLLSTYPLKASYFVSYELDLSSFSSSPIFRKTAISGALDQVRRKDPSPVD